MKTKTIKSLKLIIALSFIAGSVLIQSVNAQVLYSDSFTAPNGTLAAGRTPDVEAAAFSGNTYGGNGNSYYANNTALINNNTQLVGADYGAALAFASDPDFATLGTTQFQLSQDFNLGTLQTDGTSAYYGVGLGFYSSLGDSAHSYNEFYGLMVNANGDVMLDAAANATPIASAVIAGFNATANHTLSYDVNTISGAISDVVLDGSAVNLNFGGNANNLLTGANINYVGFDGSENNYMHTGSVDNFSVTAVPEPTTFGLTLAGAVLLLVRRKK